MTVTTSSAAPLAAPEAMPEAVYQRASAAVSEEVERVRKGALPVPSKAEQDAFIDEVARRIDVLPIVKLPFIGSLAMEWEGVFDRETDEGPGTLLVSVGHFDFSYSMDDLLRRSGPSAGVQRIGHYPWCAIGIPLLTLGLIVLLLRDLVVGVRYWRLHQLWLRLMWRFRPLAMTRKYLARETEKQELEDRIRHERAERDRERAAREAEREAAFEAEVERRLAARLAGATAPEAAAA
ncbi:hypothetical protein MWN34_17250 [Ancylobacter sp. 6x-1]|uniref:Uncharacterized protein n=1 Tax=Ancylobacter crimeensis TaxID=2579147 RepID=A0ABT0DFA0_9HYPH|nr:hypothetical protein [Ancylobacter crimeensis]MCK0198646.1 hypothetical protein [Ancylobacter crimeensis]